jgi:hypothetical protein
MSATVDAGAIQPGDEVRIAGSRRWVPVVEVLDQGLHVRGDWHAWHRWLLVVAYRSADEGGRS